MEILDFFPFNLPSGITFLLFYFSVMIAGWGAILFLRHKFSEKYDHDFLIENKVSKLTIGKIPEADDLIPIAYLGGSTIRAFRTLMSSAVADGWLQNDQDNKDKFTFIGKNKPDPSRFCELDFFNAVEGVSHQFIFTKNDITSSILQEIAANSINKNISKIERKLEDAGLLRTRETKSQIAMASWIVGVFILFIGFLRILHSLPSGHPVGFLFLEMVFTYFMILKLAQSSRESLVAHEYFVWLKDATRSLREEVLQGKCQEPHEVTMAVAISGSAALAAPPLANSGEDLFLRAGFPPALSSIFPHPLAGVFASLMGFFSFLDRHSGGSFGGGGGGGCGSGGDGGGGGDGGVGGGGGCGGG